MKQTEKVIKTNRKKIARRSDRQSKGKQIERNRTDVKLRQKINPRLVLSDPDVFFSDLLMEQREQN